MNIHARNLAILLSLLSTLPTIGFLVPAARGDDEKLISRIDEFVAPYVAAGDFMGVIAVGRADRESLLLPYGDASVELGTPHRPDGVFLIGSVSKQFTAAAILLLEEDGQLAVDDLVSEHLPYFPSGDRITIEQLVRHTAGIADVYSLPRFGRTAGAAAKFSEVITDLGDEGLTQEPGAAFSYSNGGYSVLAAIIERASGMSYGAFLRQRIFEPLGMTSTAHDDGGRAGERRVAGYDPWGSDSLTPARPIAPAFSAGSGSLWSSGEDLLRWSEALHGGEVLSEESMAKFLDGGGEGYGYGVSIFQRFGRDVVGHDGRVAGFSTDLAHYPTDATTIAVLSNVQSVVRDQVRYLVAAAVFGEDVGDIPPPRTYAESSTIDYDELIGVYSFGPYLDVSIEAVEGRLLARANEGGFSELTPVDDTGFYSRMLATGVRFARDESGRVDRLLWGLQDGAPAGTRTQTYVSVEALRRDAEILERALRELQPGLFRDRNEGSPHAAFAQLHRDLASTQSAAQAFLAFSRLKAAIRCGLTIDLEVDDRARDRRGADGGRLFVLDLPSSGIEIGIPRIGDCASDAAGEDS